MQNSPIQYLILFNFRDRHVNVVKIKYEYGDKKMNKDEIITFLATNKQEIKDKFGVTRIGLFGSYARGDFKINSDIDIAVEIESGNKFRSFFGLKNYLENELKNKVDLGIESSLKPIAKKYILQEIIYV